MSQPVALQTRIREVERRIGISIDDIMYRLIRLEQAYNRSDSSSDDDNEALRHEIRALREEVTIIRCTKR